MAKRYICIDDLDGETPDAVTIPIVVDGYTFEVDLAEENLKRFRDFMRPFIDAGRATSSGKRNVKPEWAQTDEPAAADTGGADLPPVRTVLPPAAQVIRMWWEKNWKQQNLNPPKAMGVIPAEVRDAYMAAQRTGDALMKVAAEDGTGDMNGNVTALFKEAQ